MIRQITPSRYQVIDTIIVAGQKQNQVSEMCKCDDCETWKPESDFTKGIGICDECLGKAEA